MLIKISDDRKLGDINKEDVRSNTQEKGNALEDWDSKNGMSKTGACFLINIQGRGGINTGKGKWSIINVYYIVVSKSRELQ